MNTMMPVDIKMNFAMYSVIQMTSGMNISREHAYLSMDLQRVTCVFLIARPRIHTIYTYNLYYIMNFFLPSSPIYLYIVCKSIIVCTYSIAN